MIRHFELLNRMASILLILLALTLLEPVVARADTINTFDVSGVVFDGLPTGPASCMVACNFSGVLTIDVTSGTVLSVNLTFPFLSPFTTLVGSGNFSKPITSNWDILASNGAGDFASLFFSTAMTPGSLVNFPGGFITGQAVSGPTGNGTTNTIYFIAHGTVVPAPTPEPSSIVLLGTGLVAIVGAVRRKLAR